MKVKPTNWHSSSVLSACRQPTEPASATDYLRTTSRPDICHFYTHGEEIFTKKMHKLATKKNCLATNRPIMLLIACAVKHLQTKKFTVALGPKLIVCANCNRHKSFIPAFVIIVSVHCREEGCIGKYTPRGP